MSGRERGLGGGRTLLGTALACALALATCTDATDVELLQITASGAVVGQAYLDLNGTGEPDGGDEPLTEVTVVLSAAAGGATVDEAETDEEGIFLFEDVPVGSYRVSVDAGLLGDSLEVVEAVDPVEVVLDEAAEALLGLSFPELTIEEVRAAEPGRRVFTTGIALNPRQSFSDGRVFLEGEAEYLQATDVDREPAVTVGDSVRFLGRTALRDGRPALDDVTPIILIRQAQVPSPVEVSTAEAGTAGDGALDAALVRIRDAAISDTATVGGDFHFRADDGSGPVEVVLRSFLGFGSPPDRELRVARAAGMLAPYDDGSGNVRWRLLVRAVSELVLETPPAP